MLNTPERPMRPHTELSVDSFLLIVTDAWLYYRRHPLLLLGTVWFVFGPVLLLLLPMWVLVLAPAFQPLSDLLVQSGTQPALLQAMPAAGTFFAASFGIMVMHNLITYSLATYALIEFYRCGLHGEQLSLLTAYRLNWANISRAVSVSVAALLTWLLVLLPPLLYIGLVALGSWWVFSWPDAMNYTDAVALWWIVSIFVVLALLVVGQVFFFVRLALVPQAIVFEGRGPLGGLLRSFALTRGIFWKVFLIAIVLGVVSFIIGSIVSSLVPLAFVDDVAQAVVANFFLSEVLYTFWLPFQVLTYTLLYRRLAKYSKPI
jgi:hypothetical protein